VLQTLGPYVTTTRGIDISPNMVSTYNTRMSSASLSPAFSASHGDLLDKSDAAPSAFAGAEFHDFDIATVGFGFHHFADVVHAARQLKLRLRPGGVLVINDFLEGGDLLADEHGAQVPGTEGNHAVHTHGHGHGHGGRHGEGHAHAQGEEHEHAHKHHHRHHHGEEAKHDVNDATPEFKKKMNDSIVVPHFTIEGVKDFFTAAGFVDVDVVTLGERSYMEFAGKKVWRTILFARGRRPVDEGKSEL
jgi:SAM-dependent methyltransferase